MKFFFLSFLSALCLFFGCRTSKSVEVLPPHAYAAALEADNKAVLIDVRRAEEFAEGHLEGALLLDVTTETHFDARIKELDKSKTYYIYCRSGRRSQTAASKMRLIGLDVVDMQGGVLAWMAAGFPLVK